MKAEARAPFAPHPPQLVRQHFPETAAVPERRERIDVGEITQHLGVLLEVIQHNVEHGPQFGDLVVPADGYRSDVLALRDPAGEPRGFLKRQADLPRAVPAPPHRNEENDPDGYAERLHAPQDGTLVRGDFLPLHRQDAGDARIDEGHDVLRLFPVRGAEKQFAGIRRVGVRNARMQPVRARGLPLYGPHGLDLRLRQIIGRLERGLQKRHARPGGSVTLEQAHHADRFARRDDAFRLPGNPSQPFVEDGVVFGLGGGIAGMDVFAHPPGQVVGTLEQLVADLEHALILDVRIDHFPKRVVDAPRKRSRAHDRRGEQQA